MNRETFTVNRETKNVLVRYFTLFSTGLSHNHNPRLSVSISV